MQLIDVVFTRLVFDVSIKPTIEQRTDVDLVRKYSISLECMPAHGRNN